MRDEYDFSKAVRKNPYYEKMKNGYSVTVHYDFAERDDGETDGTKMAGDTDIVKPHPLVETSL